MQMNLHEINKRLKTHNVSSKDFNDMVNSDEKFYQPRKPKPEIETTEEWEMRTNISVKDHSTLI